MATVKAIQKMAGVTQAQIDAAGGNELVPVMQATVTKKVIYGDGNQFSVSGGVVSIATAGGSSAAPISTFNGALSSGKFGLAGSGSIVIPANKLVSGSSRVRILVQAKKSGTDAASFLQINFGPLNSVSDPVIANVPFASTNPLQPTIEANIAITASSLYSSFITQRPNVGLGTGVVEITTGVNLAVDNYVNFSISGATNGNTYLLLGYQVDVFQ